jgi:hypothetical protein
VTALVAEIVAAQESAVAAVKEFHDSELAAFTATAKDLGHRSLPGRKEIEDRFRREQRRFRQDDIAFGLAALTRVYRESLLSGLEGLEDGDRRPPRPPAGPSRRSAPLPRRPRTFDRTSTSSLALTSLFLTLSHC